MRARGEAQKSQTFLTIEGGTEGKQCGLGIEQGVVSSVLKPSKRLRGKMSLTTLKGVLGKIDRRRSQIVSEFVRKLGYETDNDNLGEFDFEFGEDISIIGETRAETMAT